MGAQGPGDIITKCEVKGSQGWRAEYRIENYLYGVCFVYCFVPGLLPCFAYGWFLNSVHVIVSRDR